MAAAEMQGGAAMIERFQSQRSKSKRGIACSNDGLRSCDALKGASETFLAELFGGLSVALFGKDEIIVEEGTISEKVFFLCRGEVNMLVLCDEEEANAEPELFQTLSHCTILGELGMAKKRATFKAASMCDCRWISNKVLSAMLSRHPAEKAKIEELLKGRLDALRAFQDRTFAAKAASRRAARPGLFRTMTLSLDSEPGSPPTEGSLVRRASMLRRSITCPCPEPMTPLLTPRTGADSAAAGGALLPRTPPVTPKRGTDPGAVNFLEAPPRPPESGLPRSPRKAVKFRDGPLPYEGPSGLLPPCEAGAGKESPRPGSKERAGSKGTRGMCTSLRDVSPELRTQSRQSSKKSKFPELADFRNKPRPGLPVMPVKSLMWE